ncbi:unnamed protein product [Blumeria hordei]|uniref:Uncharacterized protein n=1 Tax=Blumeria hordei TaxID=2867405 RepID=A0A383V0F5_BLUHO|nr:unnamed protein product [Blumeria hordei]
MKLKSGHLCILPCLTTNLAILITGSITAVTLLFKCN